MWSPSDRFALPSPTEVSAGFRVGDRGTHSSRTIMLAELRELLALQPAPSTRDEFAVAITDGNALGKPTASGRRLSAQRITELYGLDMRLALFRVLRQLWAIDHEGRPMLALMCALARDPLLRASAPSVLGLAIGSELMRSAMLATLRATTGARVNEATLDKIARNVASSWSQSGHLAGRVRKLRQRVEPTTGAVAYALWLGSLAGIAGEDLLTTPWSRVFDCGPTALLEHTLRAKQLGLLHARTGGGVVEIDVSRLDPLQRTA